MTSELHRSLAYTSIYTGSTAEATVHAAAAVAAAETSGDVQRIAYALGVEAFVAVMSGDGAYELPLNRALALEDELDSADEWSPSAVAAECRRLAGQVAESRDLYEKPFGSARSRQGTPPSSNGRRSGSRTPRCSPATTHGRRSSPTPCSTSRIRCT